MRFKQYLQENDFTNKADILNWFARENSTANPVEYYIENGAVNVKGNFISTSPLNNLPVKFGKLFGPRGYSGEFSVSHTGITTLENFPTECVLIDISMTPITSLIGISERVKSCEELLLDHCNIQKGGIEILLIKNMLKLNYKTLPTRDAQIAFAIIEKYLGKPEDIYNCQMELLDAGLEAYAEL